MWKIFESFISVFTEVLVDDIIVYSNMFQEHLKHLESILAHLEEANLCLKAEKCQFAMTSVVIWGYTVDRYGVSTDPRLVVKLEAMAAPTNVNGVHIFFGI